MILARIIQTIEDTQPAVPVIQVPATESYGYLIAAVVSGTIAIAAGAIIPIIRALGDIKKQNEVAVTERAAQAKELQIVNAQNEHLKSATEEVHKIVNSNFAKQTEDLRLAHEKIASLAASIAQLTAMAGNTRSKARRATTKRRKVAPKLVPVVG